MQNYIELQYDNGIENGLVKRYYNVIKTIPTSWLEKFKVDGWKLRLINKSAIYDGNRVQYFKAIAHKKTIEIAASYSEEKIKAIIYNAFTMYIIFQYERFYLFDKYFELEQKYSKQIGEMHAKTSRKYKWMFSLVLYFYLDGRYGRKYFEDNDIMELYLFMKEWIDLDIFNTNENLKLTMNFFYGDNVTKESVIMMNDTLNLIPEVLIRKMRNHGYIFQVINDDKYITSEELKKGLIRPYSNIKREVLYLAGSFLYTEVINSMYKYRQQLLEEVYNKEKRLMYFVCFEAYDRKRFNNYTENMREYFIQSFVLYELNPEAFKGNLHETYEILKKGINELYEQYE